MGARRKSGGSYPVSFKLRAIKLYLEEGYRVSVIARELRIAHDTLNRWIRLFEAEGEAGLHPKSRKPGRRQVSRTVKQQAVDLKKRHPEYGSRRISQLLRRIFFMKASPETVRQTLHEEKLIKTPKKKPKRSVKGPRFFERARPNQMWQSDIYTFRLGGRAAYLIGFMDDYSRIYHIHGSVSQPDS